jgi:hypothetical protein
VFLGAAGIFFLTRRQRTNSQPKPKTLQYPQELEGKNLPGVVGAFHSPPSGESGGYYAPKYYSPAPFGSSQTTSVKLHDDYVWEAPVLMEVPEVFLFAFGY